jgi:hypothetical protein
MIRYKITVLDTLFLYIIWSNETLCWLSFSGTLQIRLILNIAVSNSHDLGLVLPPVPDSTSQCCFVIVVAGASLGLKASEQKIHWYYLIRFFFSEAPSG